MINCLLLMPALASMPACPQVAGFVHDTGATQVVSSASPLSVFATGSIAVKCDFQASELLPSGGYAQPALRAFWAEVDSLGAMIPSAPGLTYWHGAEEFLLADVVEFDSQTGSGSASVKLPVSGEPAHTNASRPPLSVGSVEAIRVVLVDGRAGHTQMPNGDISPALADEVFGLSTEVPDIWLGLSDGYSLDVGASDVECFIHDLRPGSQGTHYALIVIPSAAASLSVSQIAIDASSTGSFTLSVVEAVAFRIQAVDPGGAVLLSRLYSVHPELETLSAVSGESTSAPLPGEGDLPNYPSRRCVPARPMDAGVQGIAEWCQDPCIPNGEPTPQVNCLLSYEAPAPQPSSGLYYPGLCVSNGKGCERFYSNYIPSSLYVWEGTVLRGCKSKTSGSFSGQITIAFPGGVEGGIGYNGPTITTDYKTVCCIWRADTELPAVYGRGVDCR